MQQVFVRLVCLPASFTQFAEYSLVAYSYQRIDGFIAVADKWMAAPLCTPKLRASYWLSAPSGIAELAANLITDFRRKDVGDSGLGSCPLRIRSASERRATNFTTPPHATARVRARGACDCPRPRHGWLSKRKPLI